MTKNIIENDIFHTTVKGIDQNFAIHNSHNLEFNKESIKGKRDVQVHPLNDFESNGFCLTPLNEIPVKLKIVSESEYQKQLELSYAFFVRMTSNLDNMPDEKKFRKMYECLWMANNEVRQNYISENDPRLKL